MLGILKPVNLEIEHTGGIPSNALEALKEYLANKISGKDFLDKMDSTRVKLAAEAPALEK